jgi:hypothetical protein
MPPIAERQPFDTSLAPIGDWFDLYPKNRAKGECYTPESTQHPAKMSPLLCQRIIKELLDARLLTIGGVLADPFGGRGTTAIEWLKLHEWNRAVTCDLEQPFYDMAFANKQHAERVLGRPLRWDLYRGDSRVFDQFLEQALAAVTSPPYGKGVIGKSNEERLRKLTQDPTSSLYGRDPEGDWFKAMVQGYQWSPGNIDLANIDKDFAELEAAAVGSPPYWNTLASGDPAKKGGLFRDPKRAGDPALTGTYNGSHTVAAVGSQPYEAQSGGNPEVKTGPLADKRLHDRHAASRIGKNGGYSEATEGQIGNAKGERYSAMCRDVYRALWRASIPTVVLVTKNPVKKQQLKRLDLLTVQLMQDAGYSLVAARRAYLWQTVAELAARGVTIPKPDKPKAKLDHMFWDKWDERPYGEISFFNVNHMLQGRIAPAKWEDVLFFKRVANGS